MVWAVELFIHYALHEVFLHRDSFKCHDLVSMMVVFAWRQISALEKKRHLLLHDTPSFMTHPMDVT